MTLLICWLAFPLVLAALAVGCGLLAEQVAGRPAPDGLLLPLGFAVVVIAALFPPVLDVPGLTIPFVVALAAAGIALAWPFGNRRLDAWAAGLGTAVYASFAAPVVLSGRATFAGYIKLDDTATYLAMLDRFMAHGYNTAGLAPSTYEATIKTSLAYGYPMGSLVPVGVGRALVGQDAAWVWQPYLAFMAALVGLGLYGLLSPLLRDRPGRALAAFAGALSALLYGYALWGGIKELAAAALIVALAGLLPVLAVDRRLRVAVLPAVVGAALLGVLSAGGVIWLFPLLGAALLLLAPGRTPQALVEAAAFLVMLTAAFSTPTLVAAATWLRHSGAFTSGSELGNLYRPLDFLQILGVWPAGDFRVAPSSMHATYALVAVVAAAALLGFVLALRGRAWSVAAYVAAVLVGSAVFVGSGSPWIGSKSLATASPALVALGVAGLWGLYEAGRRVGAPIAGGMIAAAGAAAILGGVLWSDVLAYHDVRLAPRDRLAELATIGSRFAGEGPTLMTEFEPYGVRHFLRTMDAEGASELRRRYVTLRTGQLLEPGASADVDEVRLADLLVYRTLVLRRSPSASRPPSVYRLMWEGRYYQVWQRAVSAGPEILEHYSLGNRFDPVAVPACSQVLRLAREAGPNGRLATVLRPPTRVIDLLPTASPSGLGAYGERSGALYLNSRTVLNESVRVPSTGVYDVGVDGSFVGQLELRVNGQLVASARHELNWPSEYEPLDRTRLRPGDRLTLRYSGPDLHPGSSGQPPFGLGPLVVGSHDQALPVTYLPALQASALCGKTLDWIEALRS